jgi:hypothetical protein
MLRNLARHIVRPFVRARIGSALSFGRHLVQPLGEPTVHAMGSDPDRLLIVGGGAVRGFGVKSHELGLGGHIARRLSVLTGRGADVRLVGIPGITVAQCIRALGDHDLSEYDAIVLMLGGRDTIALRSITHWSRDIGHLLDHLRGHAPHHLRTVMVSLADMAPMVARTGIAERVYSRHVAELNVATELACLAVRDNRVSFVSAPFPSLDDGYPTAYDAWSRPIAVRVHQLLRIDVPLREKCTDEQLRQDSLDAMRILDTPPEAEIDAVTRVARDLFGVMAASVNFIDRDRQWSMSTVGIEAPNIPRDETFCSVAIRRAEVLVVTDASTDPRFKHLPMVAEKGVRFYAGYPIETPNGQRIGALCLLDTRVRDFTPSDESLLRELALRVQGVIWSKARALATR